MINRQTQTHNLLVTKLGKQKIILGYPWFKQTNPNINWKKCTLTWQTKQNKRKPIPKPTIKNKIDPEDYHWTVKMHILQFSLITLHLHFISPLFKPYLPNLLDSWT
jgi:hypothetical protein